MRTKASTAALDPFSQRPLLLRRRVPRHPASGQEWQEAIRNRDGIQMAREATMRTATRIATEACIGRPVKIFCRRILATALLTACVLVAPAIASMMRAPLNRVRVPRIDSRAIANLQRWANDEKEPWSEEL